MFGLCGGTAAICLVPNFHSVRYNYDYTVMNQLNYGYVKVRRNGLWVFSGCVAGSLLGYATRNKKFD